MGPAGEAIHLDLTGLKCPLPVLRTRKALRGLGPDGLLTVTCTDPMAAIDIPNLVREAGDDLLSQNTLVPDPTRPGRAMTILIFAIRKNRREDPCNETSGEVGSTTIPTGVT